MQYKFVQSQPDKLFFKYHCSSPNYKFTTIYKKLTTRSNKAPKRCKLYGAPLGVQASKKAALLKLCNQNLIPQEHWDFFNNLVTSKTDPGPCRSRPPVSPRLWSAPRPLSNLGLGIDMSRWGVAGDRHTSSGKTGDRPTESSQSPMSSKLEVQ